MIQLLSAKGHIPEPLSVKNECMCIKEIVTYPLNLDISPTEIPTPGILHEGNKDTLLDESQVSTTKKETSSRQEPFSNICP